MKFGIAFKAHLTFSHFHNTVSEAEQRRMLDGPTFIYTYLGYSRGREKYVRDVQQAVLVARREYLRLEHGVESVVHVREVDVVSPDQLQHSLQRQHADGAAWGREWNITLLYTHCSGKLEMSLANIFRKWFPLVIIVFLAE